MESQQKYLKEYVELSMDKSLKKDGKGDKLHYFSACYYVSSIFPMIMNLLLEVYALWVFVP